MSDGKTIRENAKEELGRWFAGNIRKSVRAKYKAFRAVGCTAKESLRLAREFVQQEVGDFTKLNFYGRSPF